MSVYDFNSETCLASLYRIVEEIPSGVSESTLKNILEVHSAKELLDIINDDIVSAIKEAISDVWIGYTIPDKLLHLKHLAQKAPNKKAWRPTTGVVDINPIIGEALVRRRDALKKQINLVKEESEGIRPYLTNFHRLTQQQIQVINTKGDIFTKGTVQTK